MSSNAKYKESTSNLKIVRKKKIGVIGAGVSGLSAAKAFSKQGHIVTGFERSSEIGGVWASYRSYPEVITQSSKDLYRYTDYEMPDSYPQWPNANQVKDYLEGYAEKHDLKKLYHFQTSVIAIKDRIDGKRGWTLVLSKKIANDPECRQASKVYEIDFDFIVISTGTFNNPKRVTHAGQNEYIRAGGQIVHSSEYKNISDNLKSKRLIVIGGSKSATDIAVNAARNGAQQVYLVFRRNVWRLPYFLGCLNTKHFFMRFQEMQLKSWQTKQPRNFVISIIAGTFSLLWNAILFFYFRLFEAFLIYQQSLSKWGMVPIDRIEDVTTCSLLPVVTEGLLECFQNGKIIPVHSTLKSYQVMKEGSDGAKNEALNATLSNGDTLEQIDIVIQATGWTINIPNLPIKYQKSLIDEKDGLYKLYRFAVNPNIPELGFVGFNSSFCTVLSSELIANWMVRYSDNMLLRQPSFEEMENEIDRMNEWKRKEKPAMKVHDGNCIAPFHYLHFEELLEDMGGSVGYNCETVFGFPDADKFGDRLDGLVKYETFA